VTVTFVKALERDLTREEPDVGVQSRIVGSLGDLSAARRLDR
jgi:hypothetical protein